MTTKTVTLARLRRPGAPEIVSRVAYGFERVVITRYGHPFAAIVSVAELTAMELAGARARASKRKRKAAGK